MGEILPAFLSLTSSTEDFTVFDHEFSRTIKEISLTFKRKTLQTQ